ncbi:hypothetical protein NQ317_017716 [Molorchus minor]|uniref:Uncharacterized protein n=1 Tax=Molorchus minor TaxID=1323400 RepID=A0ABQ9J570_9CUCU|nr:hypothetical protein NQ317_017716 [Molorchus minor]
MVCLVKVRVKHNKNNKVSFTQKHEDGSFIKTIPTRAYFCMVTIPHGSLYYTVASVPQFVGSGTREIYRRGEVVQPVMSHR